MMPAVISSCSSQFQPFQFSISDTSSQKIEPPASLEQEPWVVQGAMRDKMISCKFKSKKRNRKSRYEIKQVRKTFRFKYKEGRL